jgi:hypothetical protein
LSNFAGYDFIGDIHGHADELRGLLSLLGYEESDGVFRHSERQVVFLGDFIDRGPKIREVLAIARSMVGSGAAMAVMGNHEFNALAFHTENPQAPGVSLRPRLNKNIRQHAATISQINDSELGDALEWFRTLPMWAEIQGSGGASCRAVHACWDDSQMGCISEAKQQLGGFNSDFMVDATKNGSALFQAVEIVLKGKEIRLPEGYHYYDKEGHKRTQIRARWFERPSCGTRYQDYVLQADSIECAIEMDESTVSSIEPYAHEAPPVLLGHYWLKAERPERLTSNVACIDYSVAKGGFLCAYRWDGESELQNDKFTWF